MKNRQTRTLPLKLATRELGDEMIIAGYFAVFNSRYELWDGAYETVAPTAFDGIAGKDIKALIDHDHSKILGRTTAGTLTLRVDEKGLYGEIKINPDDQEAVNMYHRVKRGDVDQCSFGFNILKETYAETPDEVRWSLDSVELYEVSIVAFPAYEDTSVTARKHDAEDIRKRKIEQWKNERRKRLNGFKKTGTE